MKVVSGSRSGTDLHVGVVVASWNQAITDRLLEGATASLENLEVDEITVLRVPGALELPIGARSLAESGCSAVVAIGAVIKGDTDHYEIVVRESTSGLSGVALETGIPVTNAILAVHDYQDAMDRAGPGSANKGAEAAEAAVVTANALRELAAGG